MLKLGCGEFEVLGINQAGTLIAQRKAQGTFTSIHNAQSSGIFRTQGRHSTCVMKKLEGRLVG